MNGEGIRCRREELQLLLNLAGPEIEITYPIYHLPLLHAEVSGTHYNFATCATREDFERARASLGEFALAELPDYGDLLLCMLNSGIAKYTNLERLREIRKAFESLNKRVLYAPDTNLFYHGFPAWSGISATNFLLVDVIRYEIESYLNKKYLAPQIQELKREAQYERQLLDELVNQKPKRTRIAAYLALREYRAVRDLARILPGIEPVGGDKERNDLIIVRTIKHFETEANAIPVLLTADANMGNLCIAENLEHVVFQVPQAGEKGICSPGELTTCLFDLACVFGFIRCNDTLLFGEFRGKGPNHEDLKLVFHKKLMEGEFRRHLEVCRKLMALGIGF